MEIKIQASITSSIMWNVNNKNASQSKQSILFLKWQSQKGNIFLEYSDFVKQTKDEIALHKL